MQLHLTHDNGIYILRLFDLDEGQYVPGMKGYSGPGAEQLAQDAVQRIVNESINLN